MMGQQIPNGVISNRLDALEMLDRDELLKIIKSLSGDGIIINFHGKRTAQEIDKKVRPRQTIIKNEYCVGTQEEQARNMIIEGENLQAMVTLYKERGQVDLIVTDPPYNTGQYFRYNDRWDNDPNDPDLGQIVKMDDGSRHTKWMKAMLPRLNMMHAMLKPKGVLAICIDDNELFHLGMMLDEIFGEENRLAIINWQKTYSAKNDSSHVSTATEYVLVYAKTKELAKTSLLQRTDAMNARYRSQDGDPHLWKSGDLSAKPHAKPEDYGIQSPFTGEIHYPPNNRRWRKRKSDLKAVLEEWGSKYTYMDDPNSTLSSIVLKGTKLEGGKLVTPQPILDEARRRAVEIRDKGCWPIIYFQSKGEGRPALKGYLKNVKQGRVPMTFWADEDYDEPLKLDSQSWEHTESGHSQTGVNELTNIVGPNHGFDTVKPLKLIKKIIQLWCPSDGLVLDPYAGSGTTGHAVLELNDEAQTNRRFILVEQGAPEKGDKYARSLTYERLRRVITGERPAGAGGKIKKAAEPIPGGFHFRMLTKKIDSRTVLTMKKDELIDLVITSHWENSRRGGSGLIRVENNGYKYLVGCNEHKEGYFLIWDGGDSVGQLDQDSFIAVVQEAKKANLVPPYHVYARYEIYQSRKVVFYKIPDKILAHLGLNEHSDSFNEDGEE